MTDQPFGGALSALTHEIRVDILRELAAAGEPVPFSDLRDRVGVADPGRFNYHLREVARHFLTDTGEGYTLNYRSESLWVVAEDGASVESADGEAADRVRLETDECPVCGESECDRLVHVHLDGV
ncbi:winged helix-turn-helix domain-containing protein [Halobaculum sp. MBLA0147]|uniref:winged helix-turn-helix domain-containing protein n=1 Tax=Halobaculum sp. MBLA0147 TaxID=3079934 RepID=UPI003525C76E